MNFTSHHSPKWSCQEDQILINSGKNSLSRELMRFLPGRTQHAISLHCCALGIRKTSECQLRKIKQARKAVDPVNLRKLDHNSIPDKTTFQVLLGSVFGDGHIKNIGH